MIIAIVSFTKSAWTFKGYPIPLDCFNSTGTKSHILGPKNDTDSVP